MSSLRSISMTTNRTRQELATDGSKGRGRPIERQTENGFGIIRRCDVDGTISNARSEHCFIVRDPHGYELDITIDITDRAIAEVLKRCEGRLTLESSYCINCAERHLSTYLWENEDYPPDAKLTVDYLTLEDLDLARRWKSDDFETPASSTKGSTRFEAVDRGSAKESLNPAEVETEPTKLITESGYSIVRLADVHESATDNAQECRFLVKSPHGLEREISVRFDDALIALIQSRRRNSSLPPKSKYWLITAERYLATYLWEKGSYPPEGILTIHQLSDDESLLAALNPPDYAVLQQNIRLAKELGAEVVKLKGRRVADTLIEFARREGITHVVFGQSARSRWDILLHGSVINHFLHEVRDATVQVVPLEKTEPQRDGG